MLLISNAATWPLVLESKGSMGTATQGGKAITNAETSL
jgi:hypothetical protein